MKETVVIKGTKSGIILALDDSIPYEQLKRDIAEKFRSSDKFLGEVSKAISFRGRKLDDEQQEEIISIIHENCHLDIVCITLDDPEKEEQFSRAVENKFKIRDANTGQFFKGNLRSGQVLDVETSIIVIGDVKAGAKVVSKGNVIVLGTLNGTVYAGSTGNTNAFVIALEMDPMQIRIADVIARSPDKKPVRFRKKTKPETKIAFLENDNIYIETLDKDVMNDIKL